MERIPLPAVFVLLFLFFGCQPEMDDPVEVVGLRPIYGTAEDLEIRTLSAQEICQPGKIYIYGNYLLINELYKGIHIVDNTDPSAPESLSFIRITGNVDMAVNYGYLYADHQSSLAVFDISDPVNVKFVKAVEDAFDYRDRSFPAATGVSFECPDPAMGPVIGWEEALLTDPKCYR